MELECFFFIFQAHALHSVTLSITTNCFPTGVGETLENLHFRMFLPPQAAIHFEFSLADQETFQLNHAVVDKINLGWMFLFWLSGCLG